MNDKPDTDSTDTPSPAASQAPSQTPAAAPAPPPSPVAGTAIAHVAKPYRLQFEDAQDAWVLLYPEGMIKLNRSAGETLARCDGERPVDEVIGLLEDSFGQTGLGDDVRGFLGVALAQGWVGVR